MFLLFCLCLPRLLLLLLLLACVLCATSYTSATGRGPSYLQGEGPLSSACPTHRSGCAAICVGTTGPRGFCVATLLLACLFVCFACALVYLVFIATLIQHRRIYKWLESNIYLIHSLAVASAYICYCYKLDSHW